MSVGNSLYSHEIAGRKYREIGENILSEKFLRQGINLLSGITQTISSANQRKSIYTQLHHTLTQYVFDNYQSAPLTQPYYNELDEYNLNESQILFTKRLQNIIHQTHNLIQYSVGFTGRVVSNEDMKFAQARYYILKEDYNKASVSINVIPTGQGDDIKIQWLWAAYWIQQGDTQKAYTYINTIRGAGFLAKIANGEPESEFRLWQQAFRPFNPWINRLVPYLAQDKLIE